MDTMPARLGPRRYASARSSAATSTRRAPRRCTPKPALVTSSMDGIEEADADELHERIRRIADLFSTGD
ncbi:hypothetical protein [Aeromicrobium massiliense]|uniref:hypothetical protein n=1 Tax=Aeromicrobium massiliense TaxID=1464554 RepID=UPI0011C7430B|nr:hypothetical protein [Aeromicrobium massiliense]